MPSARLSVKKSYIFKDRRIPVMMYELDSSSLRTIDYVELPELQRSNEGNSTEDVVDQFHFDASYQLDLWLYDKKEDLLIEDSFLPANDGYSFADWHASNVLQPLSPVFQDPYGKEPGYRYSEHGVARDDVCYGMLHNARLKVLIATAISGKDLGPIVTSTQLYAIDLLFENQCFFLLSRSSEKLAVLNEATSKVLQAFSAIKGCYFKSYMTVENVDEFLNDREKTDKKFFSVIDVVLYGPSEARDEIEKLMSESRTYLQHPCYQEAGTSYKNPQVLEFTTFDASPQQLQTATPLWTNTQLDSEMADMAEIQVEEEIPQSQIRHKVATVFDSLTRSKNLKRIEGDMRIKTPLLEHQKEALDFMAQREFGPVPQDYSLWSYDCRDGHNYYEHKILGSKTSRVPVETGGGILADDMGLGKTLTVLSTIIRTANEAKAFGEKRPRLLPQVKGSDDPISNITSKSTLVLCPSPLLLEGWIQEIKDHCDGFLNVVKYHGQGRESNTLILADTDIVLSTYHTIAAEALDESSPVFKIDWFRIVLDEAHIVRRMSTKLFRAVSKLSSSLRWCLSGTPIQNSLEDLAALITFIRVSPLDNLQDFRKHIVAPLLNNTGLGKEGLRCLLDSVCLRRTKKLLRLPEEKYETREVEFSAAERELYNTTAREMVDAINQQVNQPKNTKRYFGIFQLWLRLRRLCNHGTFQKPFSIASEAVQFDPEEALALLRQREDAKCTYCSTEVHELQTMEEDGDGHFTTCGYLICARCLPRYRKALRKDRGRKSLNCPLCRQHVTKSCLLTERMMAEHSVGMKVPPEMYFQPNGVSAKVSTLITDIEQNSTDTKGIIFSCWTRSLDLIGKLLLEREIRYSRIDGSLTLSQRQKMLVDFVKDPSVSILIMTTGTGATGLNLAVANVVYILEPQWNPMVEDQAVGRVLRLGQKREVKVIRYVMKNTVEVGMRSQQTRKLDLAKLGWREDE